VALAASAGASDVREREAALEAMMVDKLGEDAREVHVTLAGTKAILTGVVKERGTQELAKEVALFFAGVTRVDNQLQALEAKGIGKGKIVNETEDAELESKVKMKLKEEVGRKHARELEIEAAGGFVSLRGTLPDQTRRELSLKAAGGVAGVKRVVDLITVAH
jgi:osmotically-inducible protein OsmY